MNYPPHPQHYYSAPRSLPHEQPSWTPTRQDSSFNDDHSPSGVAVDALLAAAYTMTEMGEGKTEIQSGSPTTKSANEKTVATRGVDKSDTGTLSISTSGKGTDKKNVDNDEEGKRNKSLAEAEPLGVRRNPRRSTPSSYALPSEKRRRTTTSNDGENDK